MVLCGEARGWCVCVAWRPLIAALPHWRCGYLVVSSARRSVSYVSAVGIQQKTINKNRLARMAPVKQADVVLALHADRRLWSCVDHGDSVCLA